MQPPRLLVVDDDRALRESIARALSLEGYDVLQAGDGVSALDIVERAKPDLVVLDIGMNNLDGIGVCQVMRARGDETAILFLTARSEITDRVRGLDAGADDFMSKPFDLDELFARVRALLRRTRVSAGAGDPSDDRTRGDLTVGNLRVDVGARRVYRGGTEIRLSKTEFELLELLVRNQGIVLDRATIYERIWGYDFGPDSKNLTVYVGYLREKTEVGSQPRLLHTVRGVGYTVRSE